MLSRRGDFQSCLPVARSSAVIALVLLTYRSLRATLCIIVPLVIVNYLAYALMVALGIGLKTSTLPMVALGVGTSVDMMVEQALEFRPAMVAVADPSRRAEVAERLPFATVVDTFADLVENADVVVNGVVGFAGLPVTIETLRRGRRRDVRVEPLPRSWVSPSTP